MVDRETARLF